MKLSIIIPVYNEKKTILEVIKRLRKVQPKTEVIIVDDGSTDGTSGLLKKVKDKKMKIIYHKKNAGKGRAIRTALKKVTGDFVLIQDADLEYDPDDYQKLLKPVKKGKAEVVYGSRFLGEHRNLLFWNMVGNKLLNLTTNLLYNTTLSDLECGFKVIKTSILKKMNLSSQRFEFEPEVTAKILKQGLYIYDVPISYVGRGYKDGKKIRLHDGLLAFWTILKYRFIK